MQKIIPHLWFKKETKEATGKKIRIRKLSFGLLIVVAILAGIIAIFFFDFRKWAPPKTEVAEFINYSEENEMAQPKEETFKSLTQSEAENSLQSVTPQTTAKVQALQNQPSMSTPEEFVPPLPTALSPPLKIDALVVYEDPNYKFEIKYPKNFIPTSIDGMVSFYEPSTKTYLGFWIEVYRNSTINSPDAYVEQEKQMHKNDEFITDLRFERIVLNGADAVRKTYYTTAHPETQIIRYTFYHDDLVYSFLVDPPQTATGMLHNEMIQGFGFVK